METKQGQMILAKTPHKAGVVIEKRFLGAVGEVHTAHGDSHHFRARSFVTTLHLLETAILPRPYDKPRTEFATRNCKGLGHPSMVPLGGYSYR